MDPVTIGVISSAFSITKKSIELCKSALESAEDVQGIAGYLDNLFEQRDKALQHVEDAKNKPQSAMQIAIANKTGGDSSDTSISAIVSEVLEQKKIDRAILNLSIQINNKFGEGTWDQILQLRAERVKAKQEQQAKAKKYLAEKKIKDGIFWDKVLTAIWQTALILLIMGGIAWFISKNCKGC
jgi:hypothetical protein|tara:strand:+ start:265 stop:813 length:549 start_codon:yes stop_codon:yes gene_type:complete